MSDTIRDRFPDSEAGRWAYRQITNRIRAQRATYDRVAPEKLGRLQGEICEAEYILKLLNLTVNPDTSQSEAGNPLSASVNDRELEGET